jgi:hypothetical protein
VLICYFSFL